MKNIFTNILKGVMMTGLAVLTFSSCNDFLDQTPLNAVAPEQYLQNAAQLQAYVDKYYTTISSHDGSGGESPYHDDKATDNNQGTNSRYILNSWTVGQTGGDWSFTNIYAFNYFIQTAGPRVESGQISGTEAKHYLGEGYFLRALEYFYRLRRLGDFPIVTEILPDDQEVLTKASARQPRNLVARFILEDLDKAISLLTNDMAKTRISKNAALILKSRVALYEASWEKYHAGTPFVPDKNAGWPGASKDYNANFAYDNAGEVNFFLTQAMDAASKVADAISLVDNSKVIRQSTADAKNPYYDMFSSKNPTGYSEVIFCRLYGENISTHFYNHYIYHGGQTGYTSQFEKTFLMQNGLPWYAAGSGYKGDNLISYTKEDRDWRWQLFMLGPNDVIGVDNLAEPERLPKEPEVYQSDNKLSTSTGYIQGKGHSQDFNDQVLGKDLTSFVVYRAAEAYLNYIEACYMKNGTLDGNAVKYWRALRTRAGVDPDYTKTIDATDMSIEAENDWGAYSAGKVIDKTLYNIRRERRCEFIGEGFRLDDLQRWRALDQLDGFQQKGAHIFSEEMMPLFDGKLLYDQADDSKNNVSSPKDSEWLLPNRKTKSSQYYNGFYHYQAHYLQPIAVQHFLITAPDGKSVEQSPIYQNPYWPIAAGEVCENK